MSSGLSGSAQLDREESSKKEERAVKNSPGSPEGSAELGFISEDGGGGGGLKKDQQEKPKSLRWHPEGHESS